MNDPTTPSSGSTPQFATAEYTCATTSTFDAGVFPRKCRFSRQAWVRMSSGTRLASSGSHARRSVSQVHLSACWEPPFTSICGMDPRRRTGDVRPFQGRALGSIMSRPLVMAGTRRESLFPGRCGSGLSSLHEGPSFNAGTEHHGILCFSFSGFSCHSTSSSRPTFSRTLRHPLPLL